MNIVDKMEKIIKENDDPLAYLLSLADPKERAKLDKDIEKEKKKLDKELKASQEPVLDAIKKLNKHLEDIVKKTIELSKKEYKDNKSQLTVGDHGGYNDSIRSMTIGDINNRKKINTLKAYHIEYSDVMKLKLALELEIKMGKILDINPNITFKKGFVVATNLGKNVINRIEDKDEPLRFDNLQKVLSKHGIK